MPKRDIYAAVDLGSNSFHMIVARHEHGQLRVIDRIKEMVRLAGGLDQHGNLDVGTRQRALDCLARFGQRIAGIPDDNIRAAGTQTLRRLRSPQAFLIVAETALGCPIDIISGREEARLVYRGVSVGMPDDSIRRLVVDIGGGSTELVAGDGREPDVAESIQHGCVVVTREFFSKGRITAERWHRAVEAVLTDLQGLAAAFRAAGWDIALGSSGTNRAILSVCEAQGWCDGGTITAGTLKKLRDRLIGTSGLVNLDLPALSATREPVFAGGAVVLEACFRALELESMQVSPYALREGLLYDMLGRLEHSDPRDNSIRAMATRYGVETAQAERVRDIALAAFEQVAEGWQLRPIHCELLEWACRVHEAGLAIAHSGYQAHSAYLLEHSDLPGFTRQEQQFLSVLARYHRRRLPSGCVEELPARLRPACRRLLALLRLAVVFCRARSDRDTPDFSLEADGASLRLSLPEGWMAAHPLTAEGLKTERGELAGIGIEFELASMTAAFET